MIVITYTTFHRETRAWNIGSLRRL